MHTETGQETDHDQYVPTSIDTDIPMPVNRKEISDKRVNAMLKMKVGHSFQVPGDLAQRFMDLTRRRKELKDMKFESRTVDELWKRIWRIS
ncbi:hypothetical protein WSS15_28120 [Acetobacter pasteurianus]|uniref:hypothetical protein n=1 Tax=Acetobacter pasteurianus TaxID=438 RepID=UPI0022C4757F|nr:hypothetical protein [Acetobacter pasteurianus]GLH30162.1 hypothetical protein WSS15_28120 [Acetobacter pasteurianus]